VPRTSIYVSDELKSRMDRVGGNWSSVAQRAIVRELDRQERPKPVAKARASARGKATKAKR
jgi:predicted transcriptional regulator